MPTWREVWRYDEQNYLAERLPSGRLYRCRYAPGMQTPKRVGLGHCDVPRARQELSAHVAASFVHDRAPAAGVTVAYVLRRYYENHAVNIPSAAQAEIACRQLLEIVGDDLVSDLSRTRQNQIVAALRATGKNGSTVSRILSVLRAALRWCERHDEIAVAPFVLDVAKGAARDRVATLDELAAFWTAIDTRTVENFYLLAVCTGGRAQAILDLTRRQCDLDRRLIDLNPAGRAQTKKRRPVVRMAEALVPVIRSAGPGFVVHKGGLPLPEIRSPWARVRRLAELPDDFTPNVLRHTVATWLREQNVPEGEAAGFMGHRWSTRTTEVYAKYRPDFQHEAVRAIDCLIKEIARVAGRAIPFDMEGARYSYDTDTRTHAPQGFENMVGATGIEPVTPTMSTNGKRKLSKG